MATELPPFNVDDRRLETAPTINFEFPIHLIMKIRPQLLLLWQIYHLPDTTERKNILFLTFTIMFFLVYLNYIVTIFSGCLTVHESIFSDLYTTNFHLNYLT